jgi:hypothetical protein
MDRTLGRSIVEEFAEVAFGDERLDKRLKVIARAMEAAPGDSLVEQAGNVAALEATYRFLSNGRVTPEVTFEGHALKTAQRAAAHESVLVVHDTTEFRFGGAMDRSGLGRVSTSRRDGFLAHYSICLALDGEPLGTLELLAWSRFDEDKRAKATGSLRNPDRESLRWVDAVERSSERLSGLSIPIHVMDREGDQFELFAALLENDERFVIRLSHDRRLQKGRGRDGHPMLNEVLAGGPARFVRQVRLGRREREAAVSKRKIYPERSPRDARLEIRAKTIELYRAHQHAEHLPDCLPLNFIEVREIEPPPGTTPVIWRLVTTQPIDTDAQVAAVIDIYRKRWVIEEFFKAIKTGCRFESHQLEAIKGLLVALSIESTIAWQLLRLRHVARHDPCASGRNLLTSGQLAALTILRARRGEGSEELSVDNVINELARLGVHLTNNGPPGWLVLKRGLRKLSLLADGLSLARAPMVPEM